MAQDQQDKIQVQLESQATDDDKGGEIIENSNTLASTDEIPSPDAGTDTTRKRTRKKGKLVNPDELNPRPSYWPLVLAFGISMLFFGFMSNPVVLGLGIIIVITAAIGWSLERR